MPEGDHDAHRRGAALPRGVGGRKASALVVWEKRGRGIIHLGVGGWTYEPWRGVFYPPGLRQADELSYASRRLTAIEVNGTFYETQKPASFRKWAEETPDDFVFTLKGPRYA